MTALWWRLKTSGWGVQNTERSKESQALGMTKERVVERERTVAKGQGGCWGGGDAFSLDHRLSFDNNRFCAESKNHRLSG
jgi:hypothetical protein